MAADSPPPPPPPTTATSDKQLSDQISQLNAARNLVLGDSAFYPQIIEGILPIIGSQQSRLPLRRWGTEFLAETFSSPALSVSEKVNLLSSSSEEEKGEVLKLLRETLESQRDTVVLRGVVETAASLYPLVFRNL